jgi:hypothetical protein
MSRNGLFIWNYFNEQFNGYVSILIPWVAYKIGEQAAKGKHRRIQTSVTNAGCDEHIRLFGVFGVQFFLAHPE